MEKYTVHLYRTFPFLSFSIVILNPDYFVSRWIIDGKHSKQRYDRLFALILVNLFVLQMSTLTLNSVFFRVK